MEPPTTEPAATIPEPESTLPNPDPPDTIPKSASTFTIKPIKIPQFIAEIWFLCRAFARFSPITRSITSCCEQDGVTGVCLPTPEYDSRQFLAAVHIAPKNLECKRSVTFETMKIFRFSKTQKVDGKKHPVTVTLCSTQALIMSNLS